MVKRRNGLNELFGNWNCQRPRRWAVGWATLNTPAATATAKLTTLTIMTAGNASCCWRLHNHSTDGLAAGNRRYCHLRHTHKHTHSTTRVWMALAVCAFLMACFWGKRGSLAALAVVVALLAHFGDKLHLMTSNWKRLCECHTKIK